MRIIAFSTLDELTPYADQWDRLAAGAPFVSWSWLSHWWRHYGGDSCEHRAGSRLFVPCVFDNAGVLIGAAPWYIDSSGPCGRVVRWLGSGEVCSEYVGILCNQAVESQVVETIADYLCEGGRATTGAIVNWDLLELSAVDAQDSATNRFVLAMAQRGSAVHRRLGPNCWRVQLPPSWEEYTAAMSKSHRKQLRHFDRDLFDPGRATLHTVERLQDLSLATELLIDLHQRRQQSLGEAGCFASPRFAAFHRSVMPDLLRAGQLQLHWLQLDGRPIAVEYALAGNGIVYNYQGGVDPDRLDQSPGRAITAAMLRRAIQQGRRAVDFLRGDEPYKAHFRAEPRPTYNFRVVADRPSARLRNNLWLAGSNVKQWIKGGVCRQRSADAVENSRPRRWQLLTPESPGS